MYRALPPLPLVGSGLSHLRCGCSVLSSFSTPWMRFLRCDWLAVCFSVGPCPQSACGTLQAPWIGALWTPIAGRLPTSTLDQWLCGTCLGIHGLVPPVLSVSLGCTVTLCCARAAFRRERASGAVPPVGSGPIRLGVVVFSDHGYTLMSLTPRLAAAVGILVGLTTPTSVLPDRLGLASSAVPLSALGRWNVFAPFWLRLVVSVPTSGLLDAPACPFRGCHGTWIASSSLDAVVSRLIRGPARVR